MCTPEDGKQKTEDRKLPRPSGALADCPQCSVVSPQDGLTLIELILFIVIVGVALAGVIGAFVFTTKTSADPMVRKQAIAVGESLLEEIMLKSFSNPPGGFTGPPTQGNRPFFDDVGDYNGFSTTGIYTVDGTPVPGLANYSVSVTVAAVPWGGIPASDVRLVTVTVTDPSGQTVTLSGYRTNYG